MRRVARIAGAVLIAASVLTLAWAVVVWQWQDPFTAIYTHFKQESLSHQLNREIARTRVVRLPQGQAAERRAIEVIAARFRAEAKRGQAIGRIEIGRIGLHMVLVNGADHESLKSGPGRDLESYMPGQNRLVYIAGHRTTYLAPFAHIDAIRPGDTIRLQMPYGTFVYRAYMHRIVPANNLAVLRSPNHELLELQACHPRFFATNRYIVYARLAAFEPRNQIDR